MTVPLPHLCLYPRLAGSLPDYFYVHLLEDECCLGELWHCRRPTTFLTKGATECAALGEQQFGSSFQRRQPPFLRHSPLLDIFRVVPTTIILIRTRGPLLYLFCLSSFPTACPFHPPIYYHTQIVLAYWCFLVNFFIGLFLTNYTCFLCVLPK